MTHARDESKPNLTPKDEMQTPPWLFNILSEKFGGFNVDIATNGVGNSLCRQFYWCNEANPLGFLNPDVHLECGDHAYGNPPYSKGKIEPFISKVRREASIHGATVALLLPVDMSTNWWNWMMLANEWWRIPFRIHFHGIDGQPMEGSPWFDSIVGVFRPVQLAYQPHVRTLEIPEDIMATLRRRKRK